MWIKNRTSLYVMWILILTTNTNITIVIVIIVIIIIVVVVVVIVIVTNIIIMWRYICIFLQYFGK